MPTQKFMAGDIQGYHPELDATQSDKIFALSGMNYRFTTSGPKSSFGNQFLLPQARAKPANMQGIRVHLPLETAVFTIDGDGIWRWSEALGGWQCLITTADTTATPTRWTWGYLANYVYFCHPITGILCYNVLTGICTQHARIGTATPANALALCVNNGRLVVISTDGVEYWSNPSDGLDFTPALGGGGFQIISDLVSGDPISISSYVAGVLVWTTSGILRSEFTGDAAVFRHRSLGTEYHPANSFCMTRVDDNTVIILDERGLFQSKGDVPTPYAPAFNEFLIDYIRNNKMALSQSLRLEWDELQRLLYVSVKLNLGTDLYNKAFVYYPPLDRWGSFDDIHYGLLPIKISTGTRLGDYFGFVDNQAKVRLFQEVPNKVSAPIKSDLQGTNLFYPNVEKPIQFNFADTGRIMPAGCKLSGFSKIGLAGSRRAAYYSPSSVSPYAMALQGLNAKLRVGLFRPTGPGAIDEMSEVVNLVVRSNLSSPSDVIYIDYEDGGSDEDWNIDGGTEDWGFNYVSSATYGLSIIGSLDGDTVWQTQEPVLADFAAGASYYACSVVGVWHSVEIRAEDPGETFFLHSLEITAASAGRLL